MVHEKLSQPPVESLAATATSAVEQKEHRSGSIASVSGFPTMWDSFKVLGGQYAKFGVEPGELIETFVFQRMF